MGTHPDGWLHLPPKGAAELCEHGKRKMGWERPNWSVLLRLRLNQRVSWEWKEMSERIACQEGSWVEVAEL